MDPRLRALSAEEYLEEKNVRAFLARIVRSLLAIRPANIERHVANLLAPPVINRTSTGDSISILTPPASSPNLSLRGSSAPPRWTQSARVLQVRTLPTQKSNETTSLLNTTIGRVDLFAFLQADQRSALINAMSKREFVRGDVVFEEGSPPSDFFIIERGEFVVKEREESAGVRLTAGQYFGEQALIYAVAQKRSIVCDSDRAVCWAIDQKEYLALLRDHHLAKRAKFEKVLETVPILAPLLPSQRALVADALRAVEAPEGKEIVREGEEGDEFFIVLEGECLVKKGEGQEIGKIGPGEYFGERALIRHEPRAATIVAGAGCKLVALAANSFQRLLGPCAELFEEGMKNYE
jgi:cAMP-dependent protein kinase regulator